MVLGAVVCRVVGVVGTGLAGAVAYDGIKRFVRSGGARRGAVAVTAWGLRGLRAAETGAEQARLTLADVVSEARERVGEQTPPPGTAERAHEH